MRLPWDVVEQNLCVRCGFCLDICPLELIRHDDRFYPTITEENKHRCTQCELCVKGCPADVDLSKLSNELFGQIPDPLDVGGVIKKVYVGYSLDPKVRFCGSSGGIITELVLYMHRRNFIDQALVCGMHKDRPWQPNPILAQTEEEIIESAQSKYTIVPQMRRINQMMNGSKRTAIVGLPCQIHAYRKFESWHKKISDKVPLVIGLTCNSTLEIEASQKLLEIRNIELNDIQRLEYRGGEAWPGGIHVKLETGEIKSLHDMDIKSAFNRLGLFYTPKRCLTCIDYTAELSDLSVMDPWIRNEKGEHPYQGGYSLIIARSDKALKILNQAVSDGSLFLEEISKSVLPSQFNSLVKKKKIGSSIRIEKLKKKDKAYPDYNIKFPKPTLGNKAHEKFDALKRIPGKWSWTRDVGMRFVFSRFGGYLMRLKEAYNKRMSGLKFR